MKKILIITIFALIFGLYIGIGRIDPGICNGPWRQRALHISITKPIWAGYWDVWLAFGNKHWDYKKEEKIRKYQECVRPGTDDQFASDMPTGEHFEMDCVWIEKQYISESGCAYWYDNDYHIYERDLIIDLTPLARKVKD